MKKCEVARIEAVLTVDSKGQLLLPKDLRERAEIHPGDRLVAIAGCSEEGRICCLILVKAEELEKNVKETIGPMLKEVFE